MSSDDAYAAFLDKANDGIDAGKKSSGVDGSSVKTSSVNTKVPAKLESVEEYYVSEADEPFEPVSLKWDGASGGKAPSKGEFAKLIGEETKAVDTLDAKDFDPRGQYKKILQLVGEAGSCEPAVFKVSKGKTRAEYWVVSVDAEAKSVVGLKAIAVES